MRNYPFERACSKRVSFIFVTKDRASLFKKSLVSLKKLKRANDEIIVVDGSLDDKTSSIVRENRKTIDKYVHELDISPAHAVNKGILLASGKYLKYLTDDDTIDATAMQKAVEVMENNLDIDVLICGGTRYRVRTKKLEVVYNPSGTNFGKSRDDVFKHGVNAMGFVLRRRSIAKVGLVPIDYLADYTFLINCFNLGAIIKFCRIKLYHQNIHSNTINEKRREELSNGLYDLVKNNASKTFFLRFAINRFFWKHSNLKAIFFIPLFVWKQIKVSVNSESSQTDKNKYNWDNGFS